MNRSDLYRASIWPLRALVFSALLWHVVRCCLVTGADGHTPFISANDRSRWCTVRALVDYGTYEIDEVIAEPGWNTIDKVYHVGRDGQPHYYSSKPTLYPTLMALPYAALKAATGWTFAQRPFLVGRLLICFMNGAFLCMFFWAVAQMALRWSTTVWGCVFVVAVATWGTYLTTFAVTINNHLPAAAMIAVALHYLLLIWLDGRRDAWLFMLVGFASAFAASCELPALSFFALVLCGLILAWPPRTLLYFIPVAMIVALGAFGTNWQAHQTLAPAYAHRAAGEDWQTGNWYNYPGSYWLPENRRGVDRGEPSKLRYCFHVLMGHHGIWSLTPLWLLSIPGVFLWSRKSGGLAFTLLVVVTTTATLVFYIFLREQGDRNYGGLTCAFRWAFWLLPMFIVALIPTADQLARRKLLRRLAVALLLLSAASAAYGWLYPWQHPWLYVLTSS